MGTGFSFADSVSDYPKTNEQVADDLISFTEQFFNNFPILSNVPTYIVGQSYGGKIAPIFAYEWLKVEMFTYKLILGPCSKQHACSKKHLLV